MKDEIHSGVLLLGDVSAAEMRPVARAVEACFPDSEIRRRPDVADIDGLDADVPGPPASLQSASGLPSVDLTGGGTNQFLRLDFAAASGGPQGLGVSIVLNKGVAAASYAGWVPNTATGASMVVPFSAFTVWGAFSLTGVTSMDLMFNGAAIIMVTFARYLQPVAGFELAGHLFTIFIITVAACEAGLAMALILMLAQRAGKLDSTTWQDLREEGLPAYVDHEVPEESAADQAWPHLTPAGIEPPIDRDQLAHRSRV